MKNTRKYFRSEDVHRGDPPTPCNERPCFKTCTALCPEMERWVNQDYKGRGSKEILQYFPETLTNDFIDYVRLVDYPDVTPDTERAKEAWEVLKLLRISKKSMEFARLYYREGKSLTKIAKMLKMSAQAADSRHKQLKKEVADRLQRLEIWSKIKDAEPWKDFQDPEKAELVIFMYYAGLRSKREIADRLNICLQVIYKCLDGVEGDIYLTNP